MRMDFPLSGSFKLWLLFLLIMQLSVSFSLQSGNETDMQSLLAFKAQITHDPLRVLTSWNHSLHFCQWSGVTCGRRHQRVVRLHLNSSQLQGSLSPHVGNLSFLRKLYLYNNSFTHHIPQELGRLFRLQAMSLGKNTFSGVIPVNISRCSNLLYLNLENNHLIGKIPVELGTFSKLYAMGVGGNKLVGEIPSSLGNLSSLTALYCWGNNLQGGIPSTIGQLKRLSELNLSINNLTGTIPSFVYNLSSLTYFQLSENKFHGSFPPNLFQTLPNLEKFIIFDNQFGGKITFSLSNASHLSDLHLAGNYFIGKVPSMEGLQNLRLLAVDDNNLGEGEADDLSFLYTLTNNTNLEILGMSGNNLGGALPAIISNFSKTLWWLSLEENQVHGRIPIDIGNLFGLQALGLGENQLTGSIPSSIGNLQNLAKLYIPYTQITGSIPSSLGNITSLITLSLRNNKLQGRIPSSLGNCRNLLELYLDSNRLSGPIPKEVISISSLSQYLGLSGNQLTGSLPIEVGKLVNLGYLDISNNKLSGEIPANLANCLSLETLNLGGNFLQGSIPQSLSSLRAIQDLDFSHNNFTGKIPTFLVEFRLLMSLDLSFNDLEGEVPTKGVFGNETQISVVGNKKLCGGIPQLHLPKCSSKESSSFTKLLFIITISCGCLGIISMTYFLFFFCKREENKSSPRFSFEEDLRRVTFENLHRATEGFSSSNLIGVGNFGTVYRGILNSDGMVVAVKYLTYYVKEL